MLTLDADLAAVFLIGGALGGCIVTLVTAFLVLHMTWCAAMHALDGLRRRFRGRREAFMKRLAVLMYHAGGGEKKDIIKEVRKTARKVPLHGGYQPERGQKKPASPPPKNP